MKTLAALTLVLVSGCSAYEPWAPDLSAGPAVLQMPSDVLPEHRDAILAGIDLLNDAVGESVVEVLEGDTPTSGRIRVYGVSESSQHIDPATFAGRAIPNADRCEIELTTDPNSLARPRMMARAAAHEILHCMGYDHSDDATDLMYERVNEFQTVKSYVVSGILERLGL